MQGWTHGSPGSVYSAQAELHTSPHVGGSPHITATQSKYLNLSKKKHHP